MLRQQYGELSQLNLCRNVFSSLQQLHPFRHQMCSFNGFCFNKLFQCSIQVANYIFYCFWKNVDYKTDQCRNNRSMHLTKENAIVCHKWKLQQLDDLRCQTVDRYASARKFCYDLDLGSLDLFDTVGWVNWHIKTCPRCDPWCVWWDVKPYLIQSNLKM